MANTFKFGNGNWAVKDGYALAYNDENNNFKPLPFDFTRASSATRLNKQGLIETVGSGKPRIDFLDNTKGHLLLEPSRTNRFIRSEEFDNATWGKENITVSSNQAISPDGSQTADAIFETTTNSLHRFYDGDYNRSDENTISIFAKYNGSNLALRFSTSSSDTTYFDLENGTIESQGSNDAKMIAYPNGWYRCIITDAPSGTTDPIFNLYQTSGSLTYTGNASNGVYLWGAQAETGSYQTSYVKTEGSSVTRVAETANGAGNSTVFNDSEGVLFIECSLFTNSGENNYFSIGDTTGTRDSVELHFRSESSRIRGIIYSNDSATVNISTYSFNKTNNNKIAFKYKDNDFAIWVNGTEAVTASSGTSPLKLSNLQFADANNSNRWYGKCKKVLVYNTALTDTELQNLTS